ncbi:MAG: hypothetical protein ACNI26_12865 [Terasakiella sp.]|uniref:hypothetical protein n=1 Tax=unclassified Terasakiella TaxID=2614952 RepID=UPI003B00C95F
MSNPNTFPSKARSLVEFSNSPTRELCVTDNLQAKNGKIIQDDKLSQIDFMVQYQGYWFAVHVRPQGTKSFLHIHGIIGKLPYSYESTFARANVLAVVKAAGKALGGRVKIDDNQNIILIDKLSFEGNISPKILLAETTKVLLRVKPYLQLVHTLQPPKDIAFRAPKNYVEQIPPQDMPTPSPVDEPSKQMDEEKVPMKLKTNHVKLKVKPVIKLKPN